MNDDIVINRISNSKSPDDLAEILCKLLMSNISVWLNEDGSECFYEIRARVDKINGIKIEIRPRDHAPPHFHVTSGNNSASVSLDNGEILAGNFDLREMKIIKHYFKYAKPKLIEIWNKTRPSDSTVGEYFMKSGIENGYR